MAVAVMGAAPWLVGWTYGAKYAAAIPILQVLIWKTVGMALSTASGYLIVIEGIQKLTVLRNLIGCVACVGLNWILLPRWGVMGAAWATLVTVALSGFLANAIIPPYRDIFLLQVRALLTGWKGLFKIRTLFGGGKDMAHA